MSKCPYTTLMRPAGALTFLFLVSLAMISGALAFQYIGGMQPCILCYYQRGPWTAAAILSFLILALMKTKLPVQWHHIFPWAVVICSLLYLTGSGIALYHVGVEYRWWAGPDVCALPGQGGASLDDLFNQIINTPIVRCDEVVWSLFGISMAGYNLIISWLLAGFCILVLRENEKNGW